MSHKQVIIDDGSSTGKIKKYLSSKNIFDAENSEFYMANPRSERNLKPITSTISKFFMPKPRISSHSKIEIGANSKLHAKSMIDLMKCRCPLQSCMVAENGINYPAKREQQIDENSDTISLNKEEGGDALCNPKITSDMLAITISCVMLMAAKVPTISEEYLSWAEYYLSHIRDRYGNHPPNVEGILNYIQCVRVTEATPESAIPCKEMCSSVSDTRSSRNCLQQLERKKSTPGMKTKNSSRNDINHNKRISRIKHTNSCSTFAASRASVQKTK